MFTKNPAKSVNGMIRTGVNVTATCLSAKRVPITKAYPAAALYIKKQMSRKQGNLSAS